MKQPQRKQRKQPLWKQRKQQKELTNLLPHNNSPDRGDISTDADADAVFITTVNTAMADFVATIDDPGPYALFRTSENIYDPPTSREVQYNELLLTAAEAAEEAVAAEEEAVAAEEEAYVKIVFDNMTYYSIV